MVKNISENGEIYNPTTTNCDVVLFVNDEDRCRGLFDKIPEGSVNNVYIFNKSHEKENNAQLAKQSIGGRVIDSSEYDEIELVTDVLKRLGNSSELIIDISILNKPELLILMRALDSHQLLQDTRLIYSEPSDYISNEHVVPSRGIKNIDSIPGFINRTPLNRKILLILMLGYEPARSKAIYTNYDPDETYLVVPHPPYREKWEGRTRSKNSFLVNLVGENKITRMHSRSPEKFVDEFTNFLDKNYIDLEEWNTFISPLSTKPQTVGLYFLWKKHKRDISIIHSSPLKKNKLFEPTGIANTWEILGCKNEF